MSQADAPAADWYPDPSGRFQFRYWDGEAWTGHVSTDGATDWDPPGESGGGSEESAGAGDAQAAQGQTTPPQDEGQPAAAEEGAAPAPSEPADVASEDPSTAQGAKEGEAASATQPTSGDDQWAPRSEEPADAGSGGAAAVGGVASGGAVALDKPAEDSTQGGTIEEGEPSDTNLVANQRAGLDPDVETWLDEVAGQVEPRLSRIETGWTSQPQAEAARACAYGLLIGHLAHLHPHMRPDLSLVAESHPSFTTLEAGARLDTLEQIARDPQRTAAWLGPLIGTEDVDRVKMLFD